MTPEKEDNVSSTSTSHEDNTVTDTEESLEKQLQSVSKERDELRKQLLSAKDEIASMNKELQRWRMAAKAAYSDMLENIRTPPSPLPSPKGESAQETFTLNRYLEDGNESDTEEEDCSQQGTDESSHTTHEISDNNAEEKNVLPSADEDIRLRAARTLIWADSAIKRANHSSRSIGSPADVAVPATVHVSDVASTNSCSSTASHSRPSRDGTENDSSLSIDSSAPKKEYFGGIRRFLEETIDGSMGDDDDDDDESLDESVLITPETDKDSTTLKSGPLCRIRRFLEQDSSALQKPLVSSFSPQKPPVSSYKYCNEAFQKLNEKNAPLRASSSPAVAADLDAGVRAKPYCNEAFLKLNEKKPAASFTMPKLLSGNR